MFTQYFARYYATRSVQVCAHAVCAMPRCHVVACLSAAAAAARCAHDGEACASCAVSARFARHCFVDMRSVTLLRHVEACRRMRARAPRQMSIFATLTLLFFAAIILLIRFSAMPCYVL